MSNYQGPAVLIAAGSHFEVHATLSAARSGAHGGWGGSVQTDDPAEDFYTALERGQVKIRLPDGREGDVVATRTAIGSGRLRVSGSGPTPF
ncbi:DUF4873 domain-containing protein [Streptomyces sp. NBC_01142]|uniref:DUF4873 domain-containing protein n=1 Tax=Streptomyces sp. NBC_01142 TaxID=2975865 RepID=UPI0022585A96|nr:DUF4873 domain-containing protein [Streptomyces sp. NBC_01142]MCX4825006.1 DUF4873 domain-containing protein [Streptomyces sp. NBC_01142]